jgi:positive regulator of sigma E activity
MAGAGCGCCGAFQRDRQIPLSWLAAGGEPRVGESITVEVPSAALTRVAAVLFAVPLAALLAGAWLGRLAGGAALGADLTSGIAGLICLGSSLLVVARYGAAMAGMLRLTAHRQRMDS